MKCLVTGGAGFIGSHIAERLVKEGHDVVVLDDMSAGKERNLKGFVDDIEVLVGDVTARYVDDLFGKYKFDVVFHEAASKKNICINSPIRDLGVNGGGTLNLLLASRKHGVKKFIHASTGSVYGEPTRMPQTESVPIVPVSYYGVSKFAGESYVRMFKDLDTTILRYFHVYGSRQEDDDMLGGVIAIWIKNIILGRTVVIHGTGNQTRCFTHVKDIVDINMKCINKYNNMTFNCASGITITLNEVLLLIKSKLGLMPKIKHTSNLEGDILNFNVSPRYIKEHLGINFTNINDGLDDTVEYYKLLYKKV